MATTTETATLGGGCFWCLEAVFEQLEGVERVVSGYAGGASAAPTYEEVCGGDSGHAEVVQVTFDPARLPFEELLRVFFTIHDPTTKDRQGNDVGSQYRSVVFLHTLAQREAARRVMNEVESAGVYDGPLVTELAPYTAFHAAEAYHQGYYRSNPTQGYCRFVVAPKVAKFRQTWAHRVRGAAARAT